MRFHTIVWYKSAMNLRSLSDEILLENTLRLAKRERETTLEVLQHLREVERRSLYAVLAYPSLFEYTVKELKYSAGAAQRRIASMRLLKELPEKEALNVEEKIERGELTLSALSQAQSFFKHEKSTQEEKKEVLLSIENKSTREVERELVARSTDPQIFVAEKLRPVSKTCTELKLLVNEDFLGELEELRAFLAAKYPKASIKELLAYALTQTLKDLRPKAPKVIQETQRINSSKIVEKKLTKAKTLAEKNSNKNSRYIPVQVRREVWQRDRGHCTYVNPLTKKCCSSKHGLELDHIHPHALGGDSSTENMRLRCKAHNQLAAVQSFGRRHMRTFIPRMS